MSNRYVWGRYGLVYGEPTPYALSTGTTAGPSPTTIICTSSPSNVIANPSEIQAGGQYCSSQIVSPSRTLQLVTGNTVTIDAGEYFQFTSDSLFIHNVYYNQGSSFRLQYSSSSTNYVTFVNARNNVKSVVCFAEQGSLVGTVSNSGASTYPPRDYPSKSARIWPYSAPGMRGSGRVSTSMYPLLGAALTM